MRRKMPTDRGGKMAKAANAGALPANMFWWAVR
jgi:hypothetical protein